MTLTAEHVADEVASEPTSPDLFRIEPPAAPPAVAANAPAARWPVWALLASQAVSLGVLYWQGTSGERAAGARLAEVEARLAAIDDRLADQEKDPPGAHPALLAAVVAQVRDSVPVEVRNAVSRDVKKAVIDEVKKSVSSEIKNALGEEVRQAVDAKVRPAVVEEVAAMRKAVADEVKRSVEAERAGLAKEVRSAVAAQTSAVVPEVKKAAAADLKAVRGQFDEALKKAGEQGSEDARMIAQSEVGRPVAALGKEVRAVADEVKALSAQMRRDGEKHDVALVMWHAANLDANEFVPAARGLAAEVPSPARPGHRLGVFVASNDKIGKRLRPMDESGPFAKVALPFQKESSEMPDKLRPDDVFGPGKSDPWRRRCVVVVSARTAPPRGDDWAEVGFDALLVGEADAQNLAEWSRFCGRHRGVAVPLAATNRTGPPTVRQDELNHHLRRLTAGR